MTTQTDDAETAVPADHGYCSLVIECPARCADRGCGDHQRGTWRKSKRLCSDLTVEEAQAALAQHAEEFPNSGPYRLVEYVTSHVTTVTVLGETPAAEPAG